MMPMYMDSSQSGQMRPQGHYHQGFVNNHNHMVMDGSSPASCECWPTPPSCYGSCVHGNFPAYNAYWPPCYPPQVQYHPCCVNHSGFHPHAGHAPSYYGYQAYPVAVRPWCDSERKQGCGACSPQRWYPKNDGGVVIEEHEPEVKKGEAVDPVRSSNCPYPVIWFPYENAKNQEHGTGSHEQSSASVQAPENMKIQKSDPRVRNGYFPFDESTLKSLLQNQDINKMQNGKTVELPFDISKLKSLLQGQDGKAMQVQKNKEEQNQDSQKMHNGNTVELPFDISKLKSLLQGLDEKGDQFPKNKEKTGQSPYPIFWIPSHGKQDVATSESEERRDEDRNLKSVPSGHSNEGQVTQYKSKGMNGEEKSSMRNIPVKNHIQEPRKIPVQLSENHLPKATEPVKSIAKTKPVENTNGNPKKEQPSSPPKASRLPPVCLRVDPLPKRKSGGSKSLSPPRRKEQSLKAEESKVASPLSSKKAEAMVVPEACNVKCEGEKKEKKISQGCLNATETENDSVESYLNHQDGANCEFVKPCETKENGGKPAKKTFTEEEAAKIIQTKFRGYVVRKGEPIKKLKEIANVRKQMGDVQRCIKELEVSTDQHIQEKEIVILGEMVMSLLLKLDSVQGLHPSIRDYRKQLARELSVMQDKVDSMKKSNAEKNAVENQVEITSRTGDQSVNMEDIQLAEDHKVVDEGKTEKVFLPSSEGHASGVMSTVDEGPAPETEKGTGLSETLATGPEPADKTSVCEALATSTVAPEKMREVETVLSGSTPSADEATAGNIDDGKVVLEKLEEPLHELQQVVETTPGVGCEGLENATEVPETDVADASENDKKREDDTKLSTEKDVELSEILPVGVIGDGTELLSQDSETAASEAASSSTINPEGTGEVETVLPINPPSADGNGETAINIEEEKAEVEKLEDTFHELPQVVKPSPEPGCEGRENATEVSETEAKASENDDKKGDDDTLLPSHKEAELSELPVGVIDDDMQILSQDSSSCIPEAQTSAMDPETASQEETSAEHSKSLGQKTSEPQVETEQPPKMEVTEHEIPEEPEKLMEENQQSKETMETSEQQEETKQPPATEVTKHETSEEAKKLMEENQRFKETMETLVKAGREQLDIISQLTDRVKSLEKKLSHKKKRTQVGLRKPYRGKYTTKPMSANSTETTL